MTAAQGDGGGVTAAEAEAAGRARVRQLIAGNRFGLWQITDPARIEMAVEQCWLGYAADMQPALRAAAAARPAPAGGAEEVARLRGQVADFTEDLTRGNRAMLSIATQRDVAEAALADARAENDRLRQGKDRFKAGVRAAVTWLHARARTMNDPNAKAVLDCAGDHLGKAMARHGDHPAEAVAADALATAWNVAAKHEMEAVRLRAVLRQVEWRGDERVTEGSFAICPSCGAYQVDGHAPDCVLAAALAPERTPS